MAEAESSGDRFIDPEDSNNFDDLGCDESANDAMNAMDMFDRRFGGADSSDDDLPPALNASRAATPMLSAPAGADAEEGQCDAAFHQSDAALSRAMALLSREDSDPLLEPLPPMPQLACMELATDDPGAPSPVDPDQPVECEAMLPALPKRVATPSMRHIRTPTTSKPSTPASPASALASSKTTRPASIKPKFNASLPRASPVPVVKPSVTKALGDTGLIPPPSRSGRALAHGQTTRTVRGRGGSSRNSSAGSSSNMMLVS